MSRKVRSELRTMAAEAARSGKSAARDPMAARDHNLRTPSPIKHRRDDAPVAQRIGLESPAVSPFWINKAKQQSRITKTKEWAGSRDNEMGRAAHAIAMEAGPPRITRAVVGEEQSEPEQRRTKLKGSRATTAAEERRRQRSKASRGPKRSGTVEEQALSMMAHQDIQTDRLQQALLGIQGVSNEAFQAQAEKHAAVLEATEARFLARQQKMQAAHKEQLAEHSREKVAALAQLATAEERHKRAMVEVEASVAIHQNDIEGAVQVLRTQLQQQAEQHAKVIAELEAEMAENRDSVLEKMHAQASTHDEVREAAVEQVRQEAHKTLESITEVHQAGMAAMQAEVASLRDRNRSEAEEYSRTKVELNEKLSALLEQQQEIHRAEVEQLREDWEAQAKSKHAQELAALNDRYEKQLAAADARLAAAEELRSNEQAAAEQAAAAQLVMESAHALALQELQAEAENREAALSQQFQEEFRDATTDLREELEALRKDDAARHEAAMEQLQCAHEQVTAALKGEFTEDAASQAEAAVAQLEHVYHEHQTTIAAAAREHTAACARLSEQHESVVADLHEQLHSAKQEHRRQLESANAEWEVERAQMLAEAEKKKQKRQAAKARAQREIEETQAELALATPRQRANQRLQELTESHAGTEVRLAASEAAAVAVQEQAATRLAALQQETLELTATQQRAVKAEAALAALQQENAAAQALRRSQDARQVRSLIC